jgi:hypothetical protein
MPEIGDKSSEYPFGYGYCSCGCGKLTRTAGGFRLKFFHRSHNPKAREIDAESARLRRLQFTPCSQRPLGEGLLESAGMPSIRQPTRNAVANEHLNERLAQSIAWTKANPDFIKWHRKILRAKTNETTKRYHRERRKRDPIFKLIAYVRGRIHGALKTESAKKSKKTEQLLGCSVQELRKHLEAQFKDGMSWYNYGQWHVDHIKPCCAFDLTNPEEQKACFNYLNLQPMWAEDNLKKSGKHGPSDFSYSI